MASELQSPLDARIEGRAGLITLNEPAALNALSPAMMQGLADRLKAWRDEGAAEWVVIEGAGGKAFCAGADVRAMWRHAAAGAYDAIVAYFDVEYSTDLLLGGYPKPCIVLVDGICFGGGMGIAVNSGHCVATEFASFSMPETLIGFFPDAGATWFLARLGPLGLYLGMAGARIPGADAVRLGLAKHFVPRAELAGIRADILANGPAALKAVDFPLPASSFEPHAQAIERCFSAGSVAEILSRLEAEGSDWAKETMATLKGRSPASLQWTLDAFRKPGKTLAECLKNELDLVAVSTRHPDFQEGIRAALIDKDKAPKWQGAG